MRAIVVPGLIVALLLGSTPAFAEDVESLRREVEQLVADHELIDEVGGRAGRGAAEAQDDVATRVGAPVAQLDDHAAGDVGLPQQEGLLLGRIGFDRRVEQAAREDPDPVRLVVLEVEVEPAVAEAPGLAGDRLAGGDPELRAGARLGVEAAERGAAGVDVRGFDDAHAAGLVVDGDHGEERLVGPLYMYVLPHPTLRIARPQTPEAFVEHARDMRAGLDARARSGADEEEPDSPPEGGS